jgi:hypothetical protein
LRPSPLPEACPPTLRAEVKPQPKVPEGAGVPAPMTEEEKRAFSPYAEWLAELASWGREGWSRAEQARQWCEKREGARR